MIDSSSNLKYTPKVCTRCGKSFGCGATATGCWCESYDLNAATLKDLKDNFSDCLCPDCLAHYEAEQVKEQP